MGMLVSVGGEGVRVGRIRVVLLLMSKNPCPTIGIQYLNYLPLVLLLLAYCCKKGLPPGVFQSFFNTLRTKQFGSCIITFFFFFFFSFFFFCWPLWIIPPPPPPPSSSSFAGHCEFLLLLLLLLFLFLLKKLWVDQHNNWQDNWDALRSLLPLRNSWGVPEPQHFTNKTVRKLRYATSLPLSIIITVTKLWVNQRNRWQQRCNQVSVSTDKIATT